MDSKTKWQKLIDDYQRSGMTKAAYCRQCCVSLSQFQYWYYKIIRPTASMSIVSPPQRQGLIPIKVEGREQQEFLVTIGGRELSFAGAPDPRWFAHFLLELKAHD